MAIAYLIGYAVGLFFVGWIIWLAYKYIYKPIDNRLVSRIQSLTGKED